MNPLELKLRNYRTFEALDLELPAGCAAIIGENGAGKSSLVNGIDLALFGPDGRSWAPYLTQGIEDTELVVELVFEHAGALYRVRRGYSARGAGKTTLDLERKNGVGWLPATREGQRPTQELVEEIVGLTRETFRASAFLSQGDGAAFTEAKPADRKRVLSKVLSLERFEQWLTLVKADRNSAQTTVDRLTGALVRADQELAARPMLVEQLKTALATVKATEEELQTAQASLEETAAHAQRLEQARAARAEAQAAVAAANAVLGPLVTRATDAATARTELGVAQDEIATLATLEQSADLAAKVETLEAELETYRRTVTARTDALREREIHAVSRTAIVAQSDELRSKATAKRGQADQLEQHAGEAASCDRCQQTLGEEARQSTIASLRIEADELGAAASDRDAQAVAIILPEIPPVPEPPLETETALAAAKEQLTKARADELQRERLTGRIQILQERASAAPTPEALAAAEEGVASAQAALTAIPAVDEDELARLQVDALKLRGITDAARARLEPAKADAIRAETTLARLDEIETATAADRIDRERLRTSLDRFAVLERAYGRDGIPALIIQSSAIPSIEAEAVRILQELGGSTASARLELRTEKALQTGAVVDALDVVVITDRGERPYETFSGGERTRLNLALRIALARLLAARRGAESRILVIDEPEFLDRDGTEALARVLEGLSGDFDRVYLISHVPDLRSAFDQTLEIVKGEDGRSRIAA